MGGQRHQGPFPATAGAALAVYRRVKLSSGSLAYAGAGEQDIGTIQQEVFASGDLASVLPPVHDGTDIMVASGAISAGATVYPAANGKVSATASGKPIGIALEASTTDGDYIEVLRMAITKQVIHREVLAASVDNFVFVADRACKVVAINSINTVAGSDGGTVTLDVRKITAAGTALAGAAAGATVIELLSAAIDLKATAGTTVVGALSAVAGALTLAPGDKIALNFIGTLTALVGAVTIELEDSAA